MRQDSIFRAAVCGVLLLLFPVRGMAAVNAEASLDLILARCKQVLLTEPAVKPEVLDRYLATMSAEGKWPDIDYQDKSRAGWQPREHLLRVEKLARAYCTEGHPHYKDDMVLAAVILALQHWIDKRYQCPNWWSNRIGVPRAMRDIAVLLNDELTGKLRQDVLDVIRQYRVRGTAANLMWSAELAVHDGCLTDDPEKVARAAKRISDEIRVGGRDGIQRDWSFFQHGPRLQTFTYGKSFVDVVVPLAWQLRDTPWELSEQKQSILSSYLIEGTQWMSRRTHTSPGTLDRAFSRKEQLNNGDFRRNLRLWCDTDVDKRDAIDRYLARLEGQAPVLVGHRHFPVSDFTVHHRPSGSFFLKTISNRTSRTESINSENLKGVPYLDSGDLYVVRDGKEYEGLQPVLMWDRLPGITTVRGDTSQQRLAYCGGLTQGANGMTAMEYERNRGENSAFALRKSWFFFDDTVVCLLGGWHTGNTDHSIVTSLEQCRYRGQLAFIRDDGSWGSLDSKGGTVGAVQAVLHNGVGYVSLNDPNLVVQAGEVEGKWASVNRRYVDEASPARVPVLQIFWRHRKPLQPCGDAIVLDASRDKLERLIKDPPWKVLCNKQSCQAIRFAKGSAMAAFFEPGGIPNASGQDETPRLIVDGPCLAAWNDNTLTLCDPAQNGGALTVTWRGNIHSILLKAGGAQIDVAGSPNRTRTK